MATPPDKRFYYHGKIGFSQVSGWTFGPTADEAGASAVEREARFGKRAEPSAIKLYLQLDVGGSIAWAPRAGAARRVQVEATETRPAVVLVWCDHRREFVGVDPSGGMWRAPLFEAVPTLEPVELLADLVWTLQTITTCRAYGVALGERVLAFLRARDSHAELAAIANEQALAAA